MIKSILVSLLVIYSFSSFAQANTKTAIKPKVSTATTIAPSVANKVVNNGILPAKIASTTSLVTPAGTTAQANGLKFVSILVTVDTNIRVAPKYAYLSVEFVNLTGTLQAELVEGINTFWVFDKTGKEVIIKEKFLKKISAAMGENTSNMLIKIPFRLKTDKDTYIVHYRWENKNKSKNLDLLTTK